MSLYKQGHNTDIEYAVDLVNEATAHLYRAREVLNAARSWGIVDIVGGGIAITAIKHQRINDAKVEIVYANEALRQLQMVWTKPLNLEAITLEIGQLATIADFIFDNPLTDIYVQNQILVAKDQVERVIYQTEQLIDSIYSVG